MANDDALTGPSDDELNRRSRKAVLEQMGGSTTSPRLPSAGDEPPLSSPPPGPLPPSPTPPPVVDRTAPPPSTPPSPGVPTNPYPITDPPVNPNAPAPPKIETGTPTGPTKTGNFQNDFWSVVKGMPVSRGNLGPVADKLKAMGYGDARVTGDDTIFVNGQEWDIVPAGDGSWQLIPDAGGAGGGAAAPGSDMDPALAEAFRTQLLALMNGGTRNPGIDSVQNAYRNARLRGAQTDRAALAERAAFEGLNSGGQGSGAFDTGIQGINENASQDIAGNAGQLELQDYQARRQDLMHALDLANAVGARKEAQQIQLYLAALDNQYRYASLNQQQNQWNDQYGLNLARIQADADRQAYLDALGR